jgi:hypothetical protein
MKKYSTCTLEYHVQFQGMTEQLKSCFSIKVLHKQWKKVLLLHILQWKSYVRTCTKPVIRKFCYKISRSIVGIHRLLYSSCCFLNTNPAITRQLIRTARTLEADWWQVCGKAWVRGQRKMSQVLGSFGLLDFTIVRPVLTWRAFWKLWTIHFFNFPNSFWAAVNHR